MAVVSITCPSTGSEPSSIGVLSTNQPPALYGYVTQS